MTNTVWKKMTNAKRVNWLVKTQCISRKQAWEIVCDDQYDLPVEVASDFERFDEEKYWKIENAR